MKRIRMALSNRRTTEMAHYICLVSCLVCVVGNRVAGETRKDHATKQLHIAVQQLAALDEFFLRGRFTTTTQMGGRKTTKRSALTLKVRHPNRFVLTVKNGSARVLASDGHTLRCGGEGDSRAIRRSAPASFADIATLQEFRLLVGPLTDLLASLLHPETMGNMLLRGTDSIVHTHTSDGAFQKFVFYNGQTVSTLWLTRETPARPHLLRVASRRVSDGVTPLTVTATLECTHWDPHPHFDQDAFGGDFPDDTEWFESIAALLRARMAGSTTKVGRTAPLARLPMVDGTVVNLRRHTGHDIMVLDFWASWSSTCRTTLPILARIRSRFRTQGVAFYAVNVGENEATVRRYLRQFSWNVPVLLDESGVFAKSLGVTAVPTSFIVDKGGKVHAVHYGFSNDLENQFVAELNAILAGQDLERETVAGEESRPAEPAARLRQSP